MHIPATTVDAYLAAAPEERRPALETLRQVILDHLPDGFVERIQYGMPGYVVPHEAYPPGYHCNPKDPLPFLSFASQKHFIALYHMGMYANPALLDWFTQAYPKHSKRKLDMGKSCVRFKKVEDIPFALIGELVSKMTVSDWIEIYERNVRR
ncbi:MAG: DUF1801 domain-containing protein [Rhodothermales bacterium]